MHDMVDCSKARSFFHFENLQKSYVAHTHISLKYFIQKSYGLHHSTNFISNIDLSYYQFFEKKIFKKF